MRIHRRVQYAALATLMTAVMGAPAVKAQTLQNNAGQPGSYAAQNNMAQQGASMPRQNDAAQTSTQPQDDNANAVPQGIEQSNAQMQNNRMSQIIQPQQQGGITYVSGGIGDGEEDALKSVAHNYNLQITNTTPSGAYTADTNLVIEGRNGSQVIKVNDAGPLFYARLPAGTYTVKAWSDEGQKTVRRVHISGKKPVDMHLVWQES
jgi:hypothetical protein